ncbi:MAG: DUF5104 domain-containing protein [Eubacterium sp.]|nr:DUF5104 domain-containing protein [Eubacterium sp.]
MLSDARNRIKHVIRSASSSWAESGVDVDKDMDAFIKALDKHDKKALKKCFSSYVQKNDKELDQEIDELFAAYLGPTDSWKWSMDSTQSYSSASDEAREYATHTAILKSHGKNYYIYIEYTEGEYAGKDRYGICCVDFTTPEVQAAYSDQRFDLTSYRGCDSWEGEERYKLHVTIDHKGEYLTCRILNAETIFTSSEKYYSYKDFLNFVNDNQSINDLRQKFGNENASREYLEDVYYKVNDGENLYVRISLRPMAGNEIMRLDLVDEDNYVRKLFVDIKE